LPPPPARIALTGATGLVARALIPTLAAQGHQVTRIIRCRSAARDGDIVWDSERAPPDVHALEGFDAIVHLAGEPVATRWTTAVKTRIRQSRVDTTRMLAETIARLDRPPRVFASASGIGYYGDRGDEILDETSAPGRGFLADVSQEWERATTPAQTPTTRTTSLRFGVILGSGGALARMLPAFRLGAGGMLGSGRQWMSWIALADAVAAIHFALTHETLTGPVNVVAPVPVTNADFTHTLGRVLGRPTAVPIPTFALKLLFGEMATETLLTSERVIPGKLTRAGFTWDYPDLESALRKAIA
jgi:uncharacterized protein (TIGR01777 family)